MKKMMMMMLLLLSILIGIPAHAETVFSADPGKSYICGNAFELSLPEPPGLSSMISNGRSVHAEATSDDRLMQIRVQLKNLTTGTFHGMSADCFKLTGFVRDRSLTYKPELIINTDYFGDANFYTWDKLPPLRTADILLIFRVNPILINWELQIDLQPQSDVTFGLGKVEYEPQEIETCRGTFQFARIKDLETGLFTNYVR